MYSVGLGNTWILTNYAQKAPWTLNLSELVARLNICFIMLLETLDPKCQRTNLSQKAKLWPIQRVMK